MHCTVGKKGANWACKLVATQSGLLTFSIKRSNSKSVFGAFGSEKKRKRLVWRPAFERPLASRKADAKKRSSESFKARKSWMSVVEHRPSRTHITQSWKNLTEKIRNFEQLQKCHLRQYNFKIDLKWFRLELEHSITPQPHPQILGGVANYGIKLWGTNAAFFVPQGPPGAGPGVGPAPPPSAAAPPGVHAQVAQNGTVYYHQPVRNRIISRHAWKTF